MTLTAAQIRPFVTTALEDADLQRLVDAAYFVIVDRLGATGSRVELLHGGFRTVTLSRPVDSIGGVTEQIYTTIYTLSSDDYLVRPDRYTLERLSTGTHPRWRFWGQVSVTYTPVDDSVIRDEVAIDLVKLALDYNPGLTAETIGSWSQQFGANSVWNNALERDSILGRLNTNPGLVVVGGQHWGLW